LISQYGVQKYLFKNLMKYICTNLGNKYRYIFEYAKKKKKISLLEYIFDTYLKTNLTFGKEKIQYLH